MIAYKIKYKDGHVEEGWDFETMYLKFLSEDEADDFESFEKEIAKVAENDENIVDTK